MNLACCMVYCGMVNARNFFSSAHLSLPRPASVGGMAYGKEAHPEPFVVVRAPISANQEWKP